MSEKNNKAISSVIEEAMAEFIDIEDYIVNEILDNEDLFSKEGNRSTAFVLCFDKEKLSTDGEVVASLVYIQKYDDCFFWNIAKRFTINIDDVIDLYNEYEF